MRKRLMAMLVAAVLVSVIGAGCGTASQLPHLATQAQGEQPGAGEALGTDPSAVTVVRGPSPIVEMGAAATLGQASYDKITYNFALIEEPKEYLVGSLTELEERTSVTVKVKVVGSDLRLTEPLKDSMIPAGYTLTRVAVEKVFRSDGALKEGQNITVVEWYASRPSRVDKNALQVYCSGQTLPMEIDSEYILFLNGGGDLGADYEIFAGWRGEYKVSQQIQDAAKVSALTREELGVALDQEQDPAYWKIGQEVRDRFISDN